MCKTRILNGTVVIGIIVGTVQLHSDYFSWMIVSSGTPPSPNGQAARRPDRRRALLSEHSRVARCGRSALQVPCSRAWDPTLLRRGVTRSMMPISGG